jgi:acetyltransferase
MLFGQGGVAVEQLGDRALALPPLNLSLARDMIERTRVFHLLRGYRDLKAVDLDAVALALVKLSQLACDLAEIVEIDVNPLLARPDGIVALGARVVVAAEPRGIARLAIRPYPAELETDLAVDGVPYRLRPIRPEDEPALQRCFARLSPEAVRMRFFAPMKRLAHSLAAQLTQIDYDRDMAFVLADPGPAGPSEIHGVVRLSAEPDSERAEFAIVVVDALTRRGIGRLLMQRMLDYAAERGIGEIYGDVLAENSKMLDFCRRFGFEIAPSFDRSGVYHVSRAVLRA